MPKHKRSPGAHFEWNFVNGPRARSMSPVEWTFYSKMWLLATQERRKIVCRLRYDCTYLATFMCIDRRTLRKLITDLEQNCCKNAHLQQLVEVTPHYIKVNGVNEKQPWMNWKDPLACCTITTPHSNEDHDDDGNEDNKNIKKGITSDSKKPKTKKKTQPRQSTEEINSLLEDVWAVYPKKIEKVAVKACLSALVRSGVESGLLTRSASNYGRYIAYNAVTDHHTRHPKRFFQIDGLWRDFVDWEPPADEKKETSIADTDFNEVPVWYDDPVVENKTDG